MTIIASSRSYNYMNAYHLFHTYMHINKCISTWSRNKSSEASYMGLRISFYSLGNELLYDDPRLLLHRLRELLGCRRGRFSR